LATPPAALATACMRLLLRLVAIVTALSLAGSSSLSAMPLVWCFGKDGHRAVEAMLHQHGIEATDAFADAGIPTGTDDAPCLDWQLLNAAGTPLGACSPLPDTLAPTRPPIPEGLSSDRQLPLRPWVPELHPVPGATGRPAYVETLTLGGAVTRVIAFNPGIKAAFLEIEAKHGEEARASVKPNPDLLLEIENFGGAKEKSEFASAETTLSHPDHRTW
jgi:hypothetical protein